MGLISGGRTSSSISATATSSRTNVDLVGSIGTSVTATYATADIAYSFTVLSTGASDVATLTMTSGAVAQTTGTPTITNAGEDFDGTALETLVTLNAIFIKFDEVGAGTVAASGIVAITGREDNQTNLTSYPVGTTTLSNLVLTFTAIGQQATVTIIGKSA